MSEAVIYDLSDEDDDIPDVQECDRLCKEFAWQTQTNEALAQSVLQDHKWNLEESISAFRRDTFGVSSSSVTAKPGGNGKRQKDIEISIVEEHPTSGVSDVSRKQLIEQFIDITASDHSMAESFLRKHGWNLSRSVNAFLEDSQSAATPSGSVRDVAGTSGATGDGREPPHATIQEHSLVFLEDGFESSSSSLPNKRQKLGDRNQSNSFVVRLAGCGSLPASVSEGNGGESSKSPETFKIISWNVDGLDDTALTARAEAVCVEILAEKPDVVFLQEVVAANQSIFGQRLSPDYELIVGDTQGYFSNIFIKRKIVVFESDELVDFGNYEGQNITRMGRTLVIVRANFGGIPVTLMTSHLESTKEDEGLRAEQLKVCFKLMQVEAADRHVIFGGDLNMREADIKKAGGIPAGVCDLWKKCGERPECANTWDMKRNTNVAVKIGFSGNFAPKCRFDRLYYRPGNGGQSFIPQHFGLVGLQKVPRSQWFPSDHWGIKCTFQTEASV